MTKYNAQQVVKIFSFQVFTFSYLGITELACKMQRISNRAPAELCTSAYQWRNCLLLLHLYHRSTSAGIHTRLKSAQPLSLEQAVPFRVIRTKETICTCATNVHSMAIVCCPYVRIPVANFGFSGFSLLDTCTACSTHIPSVPNCRLSRPWRKLLSMFAANMANKCEKL